MASQFFTSNGSWTVPSGVARADFYILSGGGGGAAFNGAVVGGGGGQGGHLVIAKHVPVGVNSSINITIGAGGAGGELIGTIAGGVGGSTIVDGLNGPSIEVLGGAGGQDGGGGGGGSLTSPSQGWWEYYAGGIGGTTVEATVGGGGGAASYAGAGGTGDPDALVDIAGYINDVTIGTVTYDSVGGTGANGFTSPSSPTGYGAGGAGGNDNSGNGTNGTQGFVIVVWNTVFDEATVMNGTDTFDPTSPDTIDSVLVRCVSTGATGDEGVGEGGTGGAGGNYVEKLISAGSLASLPFPWTFNQSTSTVYSDVTPVATPGSSDIFTFGGLGFDAGPGQGGGGGGAAGPMGSGISAVDINGGAANGGYASELGAGMTSSPLWVDGYQVAPGIYENAGRGGSGGDSEAGQPGNSPGGGGGGGHDSFMGGVGGDYAWVVFIKRVVESEPSGTSTIPYARIVDSRNLNYQGSVILNIETPIGDSKTNRNDAKIVRTSHPSGFNSQYEVTDYLVGSGVFGTERQRTTYLTSKRIRNV